MKFVWMSMPLCLVLLAWWTATSLVDPSGVAPSGTSKQPATRPTSEPAETERVWDFRKGATVDVVDWPDGFDGVDTGYGQHLWKARGRTRIRVIAPDGTEAVYECDSFQVRRKGRRLASVGLYLPCDTADGVYSTAKRMNEHWKVGQLDDLEQWYAFNGPARRGSPTNMCQMYNSRDHAPSRSVAVYSCYRARESKWFVNFALGFER